MHILCEAQILWTAFDMKTRESLKNTENTNHTNLENASQWELFWLTSSRSALVLPTLGLFSMNHSINSAKHL